MASRLVIAFMWLGLSAISTPNVRAADPDKYRAWTAHFRSKDPVVEAKKNFEKGEVYLIGAHGAGGGYFPGLPHAVGTSLEQKHRARYLPDVSDAVGGGTHGIYVEVACEYARIYNRTTAGLLGIALPEEPAAKPK